VEVLAMSVLLQKELRQTWRTFRLPALYIVLLFLAITDPLSTRYMGEILGKFATGITIVAPPPSAEMAVGSFVSDIVEIGLLVIIAITMGAVANEKASGVTAFVVTKPVSRSSYVCAKYLVLAAGIALGIAVGVAVASLYTWTLIGPVDPSLAALAALAVCIYAEFIMSATFAASMVTSGGLPAGAVGLGFMILMGLGSAFFGQTAIGAYLPTSLIGYANSLLSGSALSQKTSGLSALSILRPGITAVVISAALLWAGFARFKKQALQ